MKRHDPPTIVATLLAALAMALSPLALPDAEACGTFFGGLKSRKPCRAMRVHVPAETFPLNLAEEIRVSTATLSGALRPDDKFTATPRVYRKTKDGWKKVAYRLTDRGNLSPGARFLRLTDPNPGTYSVVWTKEECSEKPAPVGEGREVKRFTLMKSAEPPTAFGTTEVTRNEFVSEQVMRGVGGDCKKIYAVENARKLEFTVNLDESIKRWGRAYSVALEIDGELAIGYSKVGEEAVEKGTATQDLRQVCENDDGKRIHWKIRPGKHTARLVARIPGRDPVRSKPVEFEFDCP